MCLDWCQYDAMNDVEPEPNPESEERNSLEEPINSPVPHEINLKPQVVRDPFYDPTLPVIRVRCNNYPCKNFGNEAKGGQCNSCSAGNPPESNERFPQPGADLPAKNII